LRIVYSSKDVFGQDEYIVGYEQKPEEQIKNLLGENVK
jgi:hypothetical protein